MTATAEHQMDSISTFDITKYPLFDVLKDIKIGRIQLPDFQRDWVWDDTHVRRLLASISLAYPIGAVMMLQQGIERQQFKPRLLDGVATTATQTPNLLVLDGQQRLTTSFMVLLSEQPVVIKDPSQKLRVSTTIPARSGLKALKSIVFLRNFYGFNNHSG